MDDVLFAPSVYCAKQGESRIFRRLWGVRMQFSVSLKQPHLFRRLYRRGASAADRNLVLYCRHNGQQTNRIGLTVSAKLGHAVHRNRLRRRLREIYRTQEGSFQPGWDWIVVARTHAMDATYQDLERSYLNLASRLGLLHREPKE
jgi:ribonuclease P protein component